MVISGQSFDIVASPAILDGHSGMTIVVLRSSSKLDWISRR